MRKRKEFRSPTGEAVTVFSDDFVHSARITNDWTICNDSLWKAAYAAGCISKDMANKGFDKEQTLAVIKREELVYEQNVLEAMKQIIEEGDPSKVSKDGKPTVGAIADLVSKAPSAQLRSRLYKKIIGE